MSNWHHDRAREVDDTRSTSQRMILSEDSVLLAVIKNDLLSEQFYFLTYNAV
jgi:hypothetical protein